MSDNWFTADEASELWKLMIGAYIGEGQFRRVFTLQNNDDLVIKVEQGRGEFHNIQEWRNWLEVQNTPLAKWFAPCVAISENGRFLLQKRTVPVSIRELPKKVPACLTDRKTSNFGLLDKKVVCHDYAFMIFNFSARLIKPNFWE